MMKLKLGMVEAARVELFGVLIIRKLLILRMARRARKAPLSDPLYVHCTKMLFALGSHGPPHTEQSIPQIRRDGSEKVGRISQTLPCKSGKMTPQNIFQS